MKFILAFMFLFCMNCLSPTVILAITNPILIVDYSTLANKKLSLKETVPFELLKKKSEDTKKKKNWKLPVFLIVFGFVLAIIAAYQTPTSPTSGGLVPPDPFIGFGLFLLGMLSCNIGFCIFLTRFFKKMKINNPN
jgi:hypothetical protein